MKVYHYRILEPLSRSLELRTLSCAASVSAGVVGNGFFPSLSTWLCGVVGIYLASVEVGNLLKTPETLLRHPKKHPKHYATTKSPDNSQFCPLILQIQVPC